MVGFKLVYWRLEVGFFSNHFDKVNHAVAKAPFVVIPCKNLNEIALLT
jgi:hypothetical protein